MAITQVVYQKKSTKTLLKKFDETKQGRIMRIIQNFTDIELKNLLNDFYRYFQSGFEFEEFLKPFLESLGLSEVAVTQKTKDDGVDLTAVKEGLTDINNADSVNYRIQAKRYAPSSIISPEKIDALRGNLAFNEKGLFITTARVSENAKENAVSKDPYKPVFVIDGSDLIKLCIEKQIGFAYRPVFSGEALDEFTNKSFKSNIAEVKKDYTIEGNENTVKKLITANDVRCSLISVPRFIVDYIKNNHLKQKLKVIINGDKYQLTFSPVRKYLYLPNSKDVFQKYGIIQFDGSVIPKEAIWMIDESQVITINIK